MSASAPIVRALNVWAAERKPKQTRTGTSTKMLIEVLRATISHRRSFFRAIFIRRFQTFNSPYSSLAPHAPQNADPGANGTPHFRQKVCRTGPKPRAGEADGARGPVAVGGGAT